MVQKVRWRDETIFLLEHHLAPFTKTENFSPSMDK